MSMLLYILQANRLARFATCEKVISSIWLTFVILICSTIIRAQGFERPRKAKTAALTAAAGDDTGNDSPLQILQQISLNASTASPTVNVKLLRYSAQISENKYWDFYILSSVPPVSTNPNDSIKYLGNELQSLYGGLTNFYFSRTHYVSKGKNNQSRGFQYDIKGGYKLNQTSRNKGSDVRYYHFAQAAVEGRYLIPLKDRPADDASVVGLVQLKASLQAFYSIIDPGDYKSYLKVANNNSKPSDILLSLNFELLISITNEINISGGGSVNNTNNALQNTGYFKVTYSRK